MLVQCCCISSGWSSDAPGACRMRNGPAPPSPLPPLLLPVSLDSPPSGCRASAPPPGCSAGGGGVGGGVLATCDAGSGAPAD